MLWISFIRLHAIWSDVATGFFSIFFFNATVAHMTPRVDLTAPRLSYGPPWAHYLSGYQDRLLGGPLGLPSLRYTAPEGVEHKDYTGVVLG
jgi:hypothetical protein